MVSENELAHKSSKENYIYILLGTSVLFLATSIAAYFLSYEQGNLGVTLKLFGEGDDGNFYWEQIQNIVNDIPWIRTSIYPLIMAEVIKIVMINNVLVIRLVNYIILLITIKVLLSLVRRQYKEANLVDVKRILTIKMNLLIILPLYTSFLFNISLSILRDIWIYGLYALGVLISAKMLRRKNVTIKELLGLIATLYMLGEFREYALVSFLIALSIQLIFSKKWISDSALILICIGVLFIMYTFFINLSFPVVNKSLAEGLNYRFASLEHHAGGSQMWINLNQNNFFFFLLNYIHSFFGNLLGPLPWHIRGVGTIIIFITETIPMTYILWYMWRKRMLLTPVQKYIMLHAFTWIGMIAISNDNIGTASRLRPICWLLLLTVFSVLRNRELE